MANIFGGLTDTGDDVLDPFGVVSGVGDFVESAIQFAIGFAVGGIAGAITKQLTGNGNGQTTRIVVDTNGDQ